MPATFKAFYKATNNNEWLMLNEKGYAIFKYIQKKYSHVTGLIPDFVQDCNKKPRPAKPHFLESNYDGCYYYNACRVPWRVASDFLFNADPKAKLIAEKITNWLIKHTNADTAQIRAGYYLNGKNIPGNNYYCPAFIGPLAVAAMTDKKYQKWLNNLWDCLVNTNLNENRYYDNTIKMLCLIILSGNYWSL
jgi:endoglucanase